MDAQTRQMLKAFEGSHAVGVVRSYSGGVSAEPVLAVYFEPDQPEGMDGIYLVKFGKRPWAKDEIRQSREHADELFPWLRSRFETYVMPKGDPVRAAIAYQVNLSHLVGTQTLAELIAGGRATQETAAHQIGRVAQRLSAWNAASAAPQQMALQPWRVLEIMLTSRRLRDIHDRLYKSLALWPQTTPVIGIAGAKRPLPNPLAYVLEETWGADAPAIPVTLGHMHGNMHAGNIICQIQPDGELAVIGTGGYNKDGVPLYDLAYLEYDILQRVLRVETPEHAAQWLALLDYLMADVVPTQEPRGYYGARAWALIRPIREEVARQYELASRVSPSSAQAIRATWWIALMAAGLTYARKGDQTRPDLDRACALLYAARALERLLELLRLPQPRMDNPPYMTWFQGLVEPMPPSQALPTQPLADRSPVAEAPVCVGREAEMRQGLKALDSRWPVVMITGRSGVGKTTFARALVHESLSRQPARFDQVIWISARFQLPQRRALDALLDEIARQLDYPYISRLAEAEKAERVWPLLRKHRLLIAIDDTDRIGDRKLAVWLARVPAPCKVLITSRDQEQFPGAWLIPLKGLPVDDALELLRQRMRQMGPGQGAGVSDRQLVPLWKWSNGNPLTMTMALGYLEDHTATLGLVARLRRTERAGKSPLEALLESIWPDLNQDAKQVLVALLFFAQPARKEAIAAVAQQSGPALDALLDKLIGYALVESTTWSTAPMQRYSLHPRVRRFVRDRLDTLSAWESEARGRWIAWYLDFTRRYGGMDWDRWVRTYDQLQDEWPNLLALFRWCAQRDTPDDYQALRQFWLEDRVHRFADIYGHWQDRLDWFDWLIYAAARNQDIATRVHAMTCKGWTLLQLRQLRQPERRQAVESLITRAWHLHHHAAWFVQTELANNFILFSIHTQQYSRAARWVTKMEQLIAASDLSPALRRRQSLWISYYRASLLYRREKYAEAVVACERVLEEAEGARWQRQTTWALHLLADIAFKSSQTPGSTGGTAHAARAGAHSESGSLDTVRHRLHAGLRLAERTKDRLPMALFKRALARMERRLEQRQQREREQPSAPRQSRRPSRRVEHREAARRWAIEALDEFERLGMNEEANEMRSVIKKTSRADQPGAAPTDPRHASADTLTRRP